ncbi:MAG: hypothetical protein EAZ61_11485 [Oscillatoriales cyanobacterium]|nr:MAG: hypothetical protein EAZ61_11485 [Oscillatoriales cyanobacterium]
MVYVGFRLGFPGWRRPDRLVTIVVHYDRRDCSRDFLSPTTMPKDEAYWKRKLEELEIDMSSKTTQKSAIPNPTPASNPTSQPSEAPTLQGIYQQSRAWFETLPTPGKGAVILGGSILALSVVRTLVQVVTFSLSFGLFLVLAYGAYRFFSKANSDH